MAWRRIDPVQTVGALIVTGPGAVQRTRAAMAAKPAPLRALPSAFGQDWIALFAGGASGEDGAILPRLAEATALYEAAPGWWLPVGLALDAPEHVQPALWRAMADRDDFSPPAIVLPRLDGAGGPADVYVIRARTPFDPAALAA